MSVDADVSRRERNERRTLQVVGACFLCLAVYITYESATDLWSKRAPGHSTPGILVACVSLVVMPLLSRAKRRVGHALGSAAMHADAKQAEFCTYLPAILLAGLLLNAIFGLWSPLFQEFSFGFDLTVFRASLFIIEDPSDLFGEPSQLLGLILNLGFLA